MKSFRLKCLMVLGVFFASASYVFAECPEITGTFVCKGGDKIDVTTKVVGDADGNPIYHFSFYHFSFDADSVKNNYIVDGVPRMTKANRWMSSKKHINICSGNVLKSIFIESGEGENELDSPYVAILEHSINENGQLVRKWQVGTMEHEKPETLRVLSEKGLSCDRQ